MAETGEFRCTDVFEEGTYAVAHITEKASKDTKVKASLPVDVFIVTPTGERLYPTERLYPVLLFCHGWMMTNEWYSSIFDHIASHGNIVVAPQFYGLSREISIDEEIGRANGVTEWLSTGLHATLQKNGYKYIKPDIENNLAVSGHSRGGKVAFALALGLTVEERLPQKFKAVIGIDPVGGLSTTDRPEPNIPTYIPRSFHKSIPVALVGTGYGNQYKGPNPLNHAEFFNESKPPICYFLAKEFGHFDMMDDNVGMLDFLRSFRAASGDAGSRPLLRQAVGGIVVAFLRSNLERSSADFNAIVEYPSLAPIVLEPVLSR